MAFQDCFELGRVGIVDSSDLHVFERGARGGFAGDDLDVVAGMDESFDDCWADGSSGLMTLDDDGR